MAETSKVKRYIKLMVFFLLIVVILVLDHRFMWSKYIQDTQFIKDIKDLIQHNSGLAMLLYVAITVVGCVVLALPGVTFAIIAGLIFGPVWGTACCSVATTLGAMLSFLVGRFFLKDSIKPAIMKNKYLKKWLFDESGHNQLFVLMITRLVPIFPFNLQNFAYGITDIKFVTYSIASLIFMLPGTAMYTVGTVGFADPINRWKYFGIALLLAVAVIGISALLKKKYISDEEEQK